jgi:hypothetical protein
MSEKRWIVPWLRQVGIRSKRWRARRIGREGNQIWLRVGFWLCFQYVLLGLVNYANATGVHDWSAISKTKLIRMRQAESVFVMNFPRDICFLGQITNERQQKGEQSNQAIGNDLYPALSDKSSRIIAVVFLCVFLCGIAISGNFDSVLAVMFSLFISVACGAVAFALWICSFH